MIYALLIYLIGYILLFVGYKIRNTKVPQCDKMTLTDALSYSMFSWLGIFFEILELCMKIIKKCIKKCKLDEWFMK